MSCCWFLNREKKRYGGSSIWRWWVLIWGELRGREGTAMINELAAWRTATENITITVLISLPRNGMMTTKFKRKYLLEWSVLNSSWDHTAYLAKRAVLTTHAFSVTWPRGHILALENVFSHLKCVKVLLFRHSYTSFLPRLSSINEVPNYQFAQ
jgi:hypothetical protein